MSRPPLRLRSGPAPLVALNGMDGAGKSSAAAAIAERLEAAGYSVKHEWQRLGEMDSLDRVALPIKRIVPMRRPVAASIVAEVPRMRGPVGWSWTLAVALESARAHMLSTGVTTRGVAVVADRWVTDSLVDLELRYGRHRAAESVLRKLAPRVDVDILLDIDATTSAARKPGDWPPEVLERMEGAYRRIAALTGVQRIDATRPHDEVLADVMALLERAIAARAA
jgi:thymidylate kinase